MDSKRVKFPFSVAISKTVFIMWPFCVTRPISVKLCHSKNRVIEVDYCTWCQGLLICLDISCVMCCWCVGRENPPIAIKLSLKCGTFYWEYSKFRSICSTELDYLSIWEVISWNYWIITHRMSDWYHELSAPFCVRLTDYSVILSSLRGC